MKLQNRIFFQICKCHAYRKCEYDCIYTRIVSFVPALCNTSIPKFLGRMPQHPGKRRK